MMPNFLLKKNNDGLQNRCDTNQNWNRIKDFILNCANNYVQCKTTSCKNTFYGLIGQFMKKK